MIKAIKLEDTLSKLQLILKIISLILTNYLKIEKNMNGKRKFI